MLGRQHLQHPEPSGHEWLSGPVSTTHVTTRLAHRASGSSSRLGEVVGVEEALMSPSARSMVMSSAS